MINCGAERRPNLKISGPPRQPTGPYLYTDSVSSRTRALVASGGFVAFVGSFAASWRLLPFPRHCIGLQCGSSFESGAIDIFGSSNFTWAQTVLMLLGIMMGVFLVVLATAPSRPHIAGAAAVLIPALVTAIVLPNTAPSGGWFAYQRLTDQRVALRIGVALAGIIAALVMVLLGEQRMRRKSRTPLPPH